ncbi:trp operon leader peptide [Streptomyces sp. NPDC046924]
MFALSTRNGSVQNPSARNWWWTASPAAH